MSQAAVLVLLFMLLLKRQCGASTDGILEPAAAATQAFV